MAQNAKLNTLISTTLQDLVERGYSEATVKNHKDIFRGLELFCQRNDFLVYNEEIGRKFIESKKTHTSYLRRYTSAVRRLDCIVNGIEWQPDRKKREPIASSCYDSIVEDFESYLRQSEKTEVTIRNTVAVTARFLCFLEREGCFCLEDLEPRHLYAGFSSIEKTNNRHVFKVSVNAFLRYAHTYGLIKNDYSHIIPSVQRHYPVPSVYSPEEVESMLAFQKCQQHKRCVTQTPAECILAFPTIVPWNIGHGLIYPEFVLMAHDLLYGASDFRDSRIKTNIK